MPKKESSGRRQFPAAPPEPVQEVEVDVDEWVTRCARSGGVSAKKAPGTDEAEQSSRVALVLPRDLDPDSIFTKQLPQFGTFTPLECLQNLGKIIGVNDYETNLSSFWILDVVSEVIYQCQMSEMKKKNQKMTVVWIVFILKYIAVFSPTREELFTTVDQMLKITSSDMIKGKKTIYHPKLLLKKAAKILSNIQTARESIDQENMKRPTVIDESENDNDEFLNSTKTSGVPLNEYSSESDEEYGGYFEENKLADLLYLTETLYKLFGNRFTYEAIRETYSKPSAIISVQILEIFNVPKAYLPPQPKPEEEASVGKAITEKSETKGKKSKEKKKKGSKMSKKTEDQPEPNLPEFMKKPTLEEKKKRMNEAERKKAKDNWILSLADSVDEKWFELRFPKPSQIEKKFGENKSSKKTEKN